MSSPSYIKRRDEALYQTYLRLLNSKDITSHEEAVHAAIKSPTERFWVSPFQAYRYILERLKGNILFERDSRRRMMELIWQNYTEMRRMPTFRGCSTFFIAQFAVTRPAPEFFISYARAMGIINAKRNELRRQHKRPRR